MWTKRPQGRSRLKVLILIHQNQERCMQPDDKKHAGASEMPYHKNIESVSHEDLHTTPLNISES
jgi:hypothetical protein